MDAYFFKGRCYRYLGKYNEAINCFDKVIQLDPKYVQAYIRKGFTIQSRSHADILFQIANELNPNPKDRDSLFNKAHCLDGLRKYDLAIQFYNRILETNHLDFEALQYKGFVLWRLNKKTEALDCFNMAISKNNSCYLVYENKAKLLLQMNCFDEAIECSEKILKINPNNTDAKFIIEKCSNKNSNNF